MALSLSILLFIVSGNQASKQDDTFALSDWMGSLYDVGLLNFTILDLSLPGTHDSMTYDLSTSFSDNAEDIPEALAWVLHTFGDDFRTVPEFARNQSVTQGLSMTEQLDAGMRFIDFRLVYSRAPHEVSGDKDWYNLHFMQSNKPALDHLKELRMWLYKHPYEVVVMWFSKHGNSCRRNQYKGATNAEKQEWWKKVEQLFNGMLFDRSDGREVNSTVIDTLVTLNQRVVLYVSDWQNFTDGSPLAYDACTYLVNTLGSSIIGGNYTTNEVAALLNEYITFEAAREDKAKYKALNQFYLRSMATSASNTVIESAALLEYYPINQEKVRQKCANSYGPIPGAEDWCPLTLLQESQTANYYKQISLEAAIQQGWEFPGAIYIDAVDYDGTIRTGSAELLPNHVNWSYGTTDDHSTTSYAYADTLILTNLRKVCGPRISTGACMKLNSAILARRSKHPYQRWADFKTGRRYNWPMLPPGI